MTESELVEHELVLNPSTRVLWRSPTEAQLELGDRAVVVDGIDGTIIRRLLGAPDPERRVGRPADRLGRPGDRRGLAGAVAALQVAGFLVPAGSRGQPPPAPRLAADLAELRVRHRERAGEVLDGRQRAAVLVQGTARVGSVVASVLAAAGVGRVVQAGSGDAHLAQSAPAGVAVTDEGVRFARAAADAVHRAAPECETGPLPLGVDPDLVVLAVDGPPDPDASATLHHRGWPHLAVQIVGGRGVVGPLVLPGESSCLRCADLHRLDRDQAWTALAVQLAVPPRHALPSDVAVVSALGGLAALQVLNLLDGQPVAAIDGTLELCPPDWRLRRRSWPPHPDCTCGTHRDG